MKTFFIALRSTIFGAGFILLWGWVALTLHHRYDTALAFALPAWTRILGIVLITAGGIIGLACVATFVTRGQGTPAPFDPPRKFVAAGPYKFVRNPMYIGGFIVLCLCWSCLRLCRFRLRLRRLWFKCNALFHTVVGVELTSVRNLKSNFFLVIVFA